MVAGQHAGGVGSDVGGQVAVGRVGQVVAHGHLHVPGRQGYADHHEAGVGGEAEQVRDDGQQVSRFADRAVEACQAQGSWGGSFRK